MVASLGDSSCYLFEDKGAEKMTPDHRCDNPKEVERIRAAGGKIISGRVGGVLSVTRSLGDFELVDLGVSNSPELKKVELRLSHRWVVVASDGLWDFVDLEVVQRMLREESTAQDACLALKRMAVSNGSLDNISIIVMKL